MVKTCQIRAEQEHHGEREEPFQKRKYNCSENIRVNSEKSNVEQSKTSSAEQNNLEKREYLTGEGIQTIAAKYT